MKLTTRLAVILLASAAFTSCVSKKKFVDLESQLAQSKSSLESCSDDLLKYKQDLTKAENDLANERASASNTAKLREEQIADLRGQVSDLQSARNQQMQQVEGLTVLSKAAADNIDKTLAQLEQRDQYINLLRNAKNKADSMNLALAINLTKSLDVDIEDEDVEIKVDRTVVMINLSDKMLYRSGSSRITAKANDVLGKIAKIIKSRPELDVMIEGYTDDQSINTDCIQDNWDLSVKRATSVVRVLQKNFGVDPNKLIAAGRGEYNAIATNETREGRSTNRRTRIILMPKVEQFYDLLNPDLAGK
ncbi:OmpA family protein [uncultured Arcticibacterium sp.]|mgnify:CR=1 FL=1|uniref:OmpA/MotB family protein n=1 Tax=uncultured Arcticibacterium sp. TaxID=2173042 RepID=UPI0030F636E5